MPTGGSTLLHDPAPDLAPPLDVPDYPPAVTAPPERASRARSAARWLWERRLSAMVVLGLLVLSGWVEATNMTGWPSPFDDEGTYVSQGWSILHYGALSHYTYWYDHPPLGWVLIGLWSTLTGAFSRYPLGIDAGRELMLVVNLVNVALVFLIARRSGMHRLFGAVAVAIFAFSPVSLYYHRMVLLDNLATMFILASFALVMSPRKRLWAFAGAGACFAAAALCKETSLLVLPALALAAWQYADRATRRYCLAVFGSFFFLVALSYPLYALLKGELLPGHSHVSLIGGLKFQLVERRGGGSVFNHAALNHQTVGSWLALDHWALLAGALALPVALVRRSTRPLALAAVIQAAMLLRSGYIPAMFVVAILPFAALSFAGALDPLYGLKARIVRRRRDGQGRLPWALGRFAALVAPVAAAVAVAAFAWVAAPAWVRADSAEMKGRTDTSYQQAEAWVERHVSPSERVMADNIVWIDLIRHGFHSGRVKGGFISDDVVWFYKLDLDPTVRRHFPHGYRDFNYIVATQVMRALAYQVPQTDQALRHSRVVAAFGTGSQRIEIRKIDSSLNRPAPAAGRLRLGRSPRLVPLRSLRPGSLPGGAGR
jgi:4-amino-4-deoxy-L-arabinose transferase-like glycosyltransferase